MEIKCNKSKSLDWFVNGGGTILFLIRDLRSFCATKVTFQLAK